MGIIDNFLNNRYVIQISKGMAYDPLVLIKKKQDKYILEINCYIRFTFENLTTLLEFLNSQQWPRL